MNERPIAVVTGASSGIGAASARALASAGFRVVCAARRSDKLAELAAQIDGLAVTTDVTDDASVAALAAAAGPKVAVLFNNAGGALGQDPLVDSDIADWQAMFDLNVVGAARVTKALLPAVKAAQGTIIFTTSTAAEAPYEGGAAYCGAKAAERSLAGALRLELNGTPVKVCEVSPGMVWTDEFSLTRFRGDKGRADAVYAAVDHPLTAADIAECVRWIATQPKHVMIERLVVRPVAQSANHKVFRGKLWE
ncbi:MAG: SDR family NAD(P)-dependent oxidoreductase [Propionibacteriaceae bacterium]|jgi:NADP-dependent 3-hydroxy acid dehydrogenase YdfG|nr:SDR family NAD(P)-dependent oxidoreductase [Propionibacteriaceae bacterium]